MTYVACRRACQTSNATAIGCLILAAFFYRIKRGAAFPGGRGRGALSVGKTPSPHLLFSPTPPQQFIVVDLIKEEMLNRAEEAKGYVFNGFPRTSKQATLFVKEIGDVDVVVYLYSDTQMMVTRTQEKNGGQGDPAAIKRNIAAYMKEVREGVSKFGAKIEKIYTNTPPGDVYGKIEAAINVRLNVKTTE